MVDRAGAVKPRALIACAHYYESPIQVGDHHIARELVARGFEVAFVANPISPLHLLGRSRELRPRLASWHAGGLRHHQGALWSCVPGALLPPRAGPLLGSRWLQEHWPRLTWPRLLEQLRGAGFPEVDLLCIREPRQAFWLDRLPHRRSLLRIADRDRGFAQLGHAALGRQSELVRRVDLVAYTARALQGEVERLQPRRSLYLPNGVDPARFAGPCPAPPEYAALRRPIAVYAGSLEAWFDFAGLRRAALRWPDTSFALIGPDQGVPAALRRMPNVRVLGARTHESLAPYLVHADLGLIPFDTARHRELIDAIHPLKLYEYLAAGLAVVAADWEELRGLGAPIHRYRSDAELDRALALARAELGARARARRRAWAQRHGWSGRVDALLAALDLAGAPACRASS